MFEGWEGAGNGLGITVGEVAIAGGSLGWVVGVVGAADFGELGSSDVRGEM